jgi:hypothetical protein
MNQERREFLERLRQLREEAEDGGGMPDELADRVAEKLCEVEEIVAGRRPKP